MRSSFGSNIPRYRGRVDHHVGGASYQSASESAFDMETRKKFSQKCKIARDYLLDRLSPTTLYKPTCPTYFHIPLTNFPLPALSNSHNKTQPPTAARPKESL
jgi:hypothetical protein